MDQNPTVLPVSAGSRTPLLKRCVLQRRPLLISPPRVQILSACQTVFLWHFLQIQLKKLEQLTCLLICYYMLLHHKNVCFLPLICQNSFLTVFQPCFSAYCSHFLYTWWAGSCIKKTNLALSFFFPISDGQRGAVPPLSPAHCLVAQTKLTCWGSVSGKKKQENSLQIVKGVKVSHNKCSGTFS